MKQCFTAVLFVILIAGNVFAAEFTMSGGAGFFLGGQFTRYQMDASGTKFDAGQGSNMPVDLVAVDEMNQLNYGGFLFFDARWIEFVCNVQGGTYTWTQASDMTSGAAVIDRGVETGTGSEMMLGFALLGKYPFSLNERFTLYPLLGVEYQIALLEYRRKFAHEPYNRTDGVMEFDVDGKPYNISIWNSLFIDIGGGVDFTFHAPLYLRAELVYAFRLPTAYENDQIALAKKQLDDTELKLTGLTSGPTLKIGVGWRFY